MAEAREGRGGAGSLEAELSCPICLSLYQDPVFLRCGHNFCRQCIEKVQGAQQHSQGRYTCPVCRVRLGSTLKLQKNFQLASIVKAFQTNTSKSQQDEGSEEWNADAVLCEYCLDRPQPAVVTCLVCEVSLCQAHLSKHNSKGFQQDHMLVEVGAGGEAERRCPEHGKLLECYCREEEQCICVLCSIAGAHKYHEVITMKEERDQQLEKLSNITTELQNYKSDVVTVLKQLQKNECQVKTTAKTLTPQLQEVFKNMKTQITASLNHEEKKMLGVLQCNEEIELANIAETRKEMEQKRDQAEKDLQALQKIKEQPDIFLFFKELKLVSDRIASLDMSTERVDMEKVQLDPRRATTINYLEEDLMWVLSSVLHDAEDQLSDQLERISKASATDTSSKCKCSKKTFIP